MQIKKYLLILLAFFVLWRLVQSYPQKKKVLSQNAKLLYGEKARLPFRIDEASGICPSTIASNAYWTHNDSLDRPRLFKISPQAELLNEVNFTDTLIKNVDWEACTSSKDDIYTGSNIIYVADSGNNFQWREDQRIYAFRENAKYHNELKLVKYYPFKFPGKDNYPPQDYWSKEGRCRDIEALFWRKNELFLISKCIISASPQVWHLPRKLSELKSISGDQTSKIYQLKASGKLQLKPSQHPLSERVTGASYLPIEGLLAVLTYRSIWFYKVSGPPKKPHFQLFTQCFYNDSPRVLRQAEAITWTDIFLRFEQVKSPQKDQYGLLILTETRGVYSLSLDLKERRCIYD